MMKTWARDLRLRWRQELWSRFYLGAPERRPDGSDVTVFYGPGGRADGALQRDDVVYDVGRVGVLRGETGLGGGIGGGGGPVGLGAQWEPEVLPAWGGAGDDGAGQDEVRDV